MYILDCAKKQINRIANDPAIIEGERITTWKSLIDQVILFEKKIKPYENQRIILYLPQNADGIALLLASANLNTETIVISTEYPAQRLESFADQFKSSAVISPTETLLQKEMEKVTEKHLLLLTSGTTGPPKCVKHTWDSVCGAVKIHEKFFGERWLLSYPMTHFAGLQVLTQCLANCSTLVIPKVTTPQSILDALITHRVGYLSCTPTLIRQILLMGDPKKYSQLTLKHVTLGGEIVEQSVIDLIKERICNVRITHIYASTELGAVFDVKDELEGFDIQLLDGIRMKNVNGELYVKPNARSMKGYLGKKNIQNDWVATKDLIQIVGNRATFIGRTDDVINIGGDKVNPHVVENLIRTLNSVAEVAIVAQSNPLVGNLVKAIICPKKGHEHKNIKTDSVKLCRENLPEYMVPRLFKFVDKMEMTVTRKLKRKGSK